MSPSGSASRLKRPLALIVGVPAVFGALAGLTSGAAAGTGLGVILLMCAVFMAVVARYSGMKRRMREDRREQGPRSADGVVYGGGAGGAAGYSGDSGCGGGFGGGDGGGGAGGCQELR